MQATQRLQASHTRALTQIALSVALIAVCTWISIPAAISFTMQTFAIFTILGLLGGKRGTFAIVCYLLMGFVGLPIFSGFRGGPAVLLGTSGGYLVGFLVMGLTYWLLTHFLGEQPWVMLLSLLLGLALLYLFGSLWFLFMYANGTGSMGFMGVLSLCVFPFLLPDLGKLALAFLVIRRLRPHLPR